VGISWGWQEAAQTQRDAAAASAAEAVRAAEEQAAARLQQMSAAAATREEELRRQAAEAEAAAMATQHQLTVQLTAATQQVIRSMWMFLGVFIFLCSHIFR
jgi:ribosome-binding ATPase YchF (GTP1/OBG family)